ncbi:MAG TPA: proton-conducting transporter membrane subunit [Candidatus Limnocylindrales bacterium]|nr:proton-conducting transporter membrane subunit [Candidatus Limnocylindrales bacterium]
MMVTLGAAILGALAAGVGLAGVLGTRWTLAVPWLVPLGGLELRMDPLAGFFVALVGAVTVPVSVYAIGYHGTDRRGLLAYLGFVASMSLVPLAGNVMTFALAWELMSLASYFLVVQRAHAGRGHGEDPEAAAHAGWVYAVMTHAGMACILAGMLLIAGWTGSLRFADWAARGAQFGPAAHGAAFALLALGFGSKAGVVPLHVWLPLAHPAAPSHVSALMSGVMIKLGVYGLMRAGLEWLGPPPAAWGIAILLAGAGSAVAGVLYALVDRDLKRLLAFSSIENVGIILIGLGASMLFHGAGLPALAVLALVASLYHTINHAVFKAMLFLGAGAVVRATGTRDMEGMGGLIKRMPVTAACFLVGALAIAALPPLNGFVSEWLTFQALLQTIRIPHAGANLVFAAGMAGLALTGGLAMACFVRAFGITFLALPRSDAAAGAAEAPPTMRAGMAVLSAACLALGLGATAVVPALAEVAAAVTGVPTPVPFGDWMTLDVSESFARLSTLVVAAALVAGGLVPWLVLRAQRGLGIRLSETWGCGRILQTARMEYTAAAFASPFKRVFDFLYRPAQATTVEAHPESRFFVRAIRYHHETRSLIEDWLYEPLGRAIQTATDRVRMLQSGSPNLYLAYILAALVLLVVLV